MVAFNNNIANFGNAVGNTATMTLVAGATYVFSYGFDEAVTQVIAWASDGHGGFHNFAQSVLINSQNAPHSGTFQFTVPNGQDIPVHLQVEFWTHALWGGNPLVDGSIALFRLFGAFGG